MAYVNRRMPNLFGLRGLRGPNVGVRVQRAINQLAAKAGLQDQIATGGFFQEGDWGLAQRAAKRVQLLTPGGDIADLLQGLQVGTFKFHEADSMVDDDDEGFAADMELLAASVQPLPGIVPVATTSVGSIYSWSNLPVVGKVLVVGAGLAIVGAGVAMLKKR